MVIRKPKAAARIIADRMLCLRPRARVVYRIRRKQEGVYDEAPLGARCVDLGKIYPGAQPDDIAYVTADVVTERGFDAALWVQGCDEVYISGTKHLTEDGLIFFALPQGRTRVEFRCCVGTLLKFCVSVAYYPKMAAKDYLEHVRILCPSAEFCEREGVGIGRSRGDFEFPEHREYGNFVDFSRLYPTGAGKYACALMYAKNNGSAAFDFHSPSELFINGVPAAEQGLGRVTAELAAGDEIVIRCARADSWGFEFSGDFCLPFLENEGEFFPATLGTFAGKDDISPQAVADLKNPHTDADANACFLIRGAADEHITAELDSRFFGQWFYALMVGEYGLLDAYRLTGEERYRDYFIDSMSTIADYYELQQYQMSVFGDSAFLQRGMNPRDLDSIGSIGMNLCELAVLCGSKKALALAEILRTAMKNIKRFPDMSFNRSETMWADDTYMSCPFLLRYGLLKNDGESLDECVRQLNGFKNHLFREDKNLFSHIYFVDKKQPNEVSWGRGNGWVFVTLSELLERLDKNVAGYDGLCGLYRRFADGIIGCCGKNGLWHQVLDMEDSYEETSCTAMFIIGLCRGVRLGLLGGDARRCIAAAYRGLLEHKIDDDGNIYGVCRGSGCSMDSEYYKRLGTVDNDDHGTGIILSALYEVERTRIFEGEQYDF